MTSRKKHNGYAMSITAWYACLFPARLELLLEEARCDPDAVEAFLFPEERSFEPPPPELMIERNWEGLHSLLSFDQWKANPLLADAVLGGTEIGADLCDGPTRYFTLEQVREIALALQGVSEEALRRSFDPAALNAAGLPPQGAWTPDGFPHLWKSFVQVRDFFREAAEYRDAMLLYIC